ncbi:hypothetical protein M434DRAFT_13702 [Hypoxylon sp. CO27-5]|nr:hypothetical protein M434DRAFT_13702 [Hypoxylon sp. CO27-5]
MATSTTLGVSSLGTSVVVNPAATTTPSVSVFTLTVKPLTTPFKPPASCGEMHLTRLSSPGNQIWLNEPQPVPGSKFSDCYPSDFIAGYTSGIQCFQFYRSYVLSVSVPRGLGGINDVDEGIYGLLRFDDIKRPRVNYHTTESNRGCSGFQLHLPDTVVDSNRPAYGGTCYSNFQAGQTVKVTAYGYITKSTHLVTVFTVFTVLESFRGYHSRNCGWQHLQQYRRKKTAQASSDVSGRFPPRQGNQPAHWDKELPISPSTGYLQSQHDSTGGTFGSRSHSHRTPQRYELGVPEPHELDSGWKGRELDGQYIPKHEGG